MRKSGMPTLFLAQATLTPGFLLKVESLLAKVRFIGTACVLLGVSRRTFYHWKKIGTALRHEHVYEELTPRERVLVDFCNAVERGIAQGELHDLEFLEEAAYKDWRAAAWRLERRAPEHWVLRRLTQLDPRLVKKMDRTLDVVSKVLGCTKEELLAMKPTDDDVAASMRELAEERMALRAAKGVTPEISAPETPAIGDSSGPASQVETR